jgi:hypothetical protein
MHMFILQIWSSSSIIYILNGLMIFAPDINWATIFVLVQIGMLQN